MEQNSNDLLSHQRTDVICAGYFIAKMVTNFSPILAVKHIVTISTFVTDTLPNTWALRWVVIDDSEREQAAKAWGFGKPAATQFVDWATRQWRAGNIGWPNVLLSLETATSLLNAFATEEVKSARLLGLGLHRQLLTRFLTESNLREESLGQVGVRESLLRNAKLAEKGRVLGYDVLQLDVSGDFDSWLRYASDDWGRARSAELGPNGLLKTYSSACECAEYATEHRLGLEPWSWFPWLVVDYEMPS